MSGEPETSVRCRAGVEMRSFPGGVLLVDMATGQCFRLNKTGGDIWLLLRGNIPLSAICEQLAKKYEMQPEAVAKDVERLVDDLGQANLVERR
jgi:Coenzyme PQQ synthesis protein D (PqqD)